MSTDHDIEAIGFITVCAQRCTYWSRLNKIRSPLIFRSYLTRDSISSGGDGGGDDDDGRI